jgi:hypothetical protein
MLPPSRSPVAELVMMLTGTGVLLPNSPTVQQAAPTCQASGKAKRR